MHLGRDVGWGRETQPASLRVGVSRVASPGGMGMLPDARASERVSRIAGESLTSE